MELRKLVVLWLLLAASGLATGKNATKCGPPSMVDSVPVVSQLKSIYQWIEGDPQGAKCTQEDFSKGAPLISQVRSAIEAASGDSKAARETQEFFLDNVVREAEGTPILGHVIGIGELAAGNTKRGEETLKSASRNGIVLVGGALAGPAGAVAGGVLFDGAESLAERKPYGVINTIANFKDIAKDPGRTFDVAAGTALDAFSGTGFHEASVAERGFEGDNNGDANRVRSYYKRIEQETKFGVSGPGQRRDRGRPYDLNGRKDIRLEDSSPERAGSPRTEQTAFVNQNLRRREQWEMSDINDVRLDDNCYYCSLAGIEGHTITQMVTQLEVMQENGGANLNQIISLFRAAGYGDVNYQRFDNGFQIRNFLNNIMPSGSTRKFGLAYFLTPVSGHMVVLKAWKTIDGQLEHRVIDFQKHPSDPTRFIESQLPDGTTYLFCLDAQGQGQHNVNGNGGNVVISGPVNWQKEKRYWINLNHLRLFPVRQTTVGRNATKPSYSYSYQNPSQTDLQYGPKVNSASFNQRSKRARRSTVNLSPGTEFIENGLRQVLIEKNVVFTAECSAPAALCGKKIVGYYSSWGSKYFTVYHAQRLTHVIFAYLKMNENGQVSDELKKDELDRLHRLQNVAKYFSHLKVMFSVGGWENSQYFSSMASSASGRAKFISSVLSIIDKYGFKGIDIDWQYPVTGGAQEGSPDDKRNFVQLMSELRTALDTKAPGYLISFSSAAEQWAIIPDFDLIGLLKYADWVNVMTYDYFGAWESKWGAFCGPPAPLYYGAPKKWSGKLNVDWTMRYYACRLKDPSKIVMGVPFYGRYWRNVGHPYDGKDGMWRLAQAVNGTVQGGAAPYYEIKDKYINHSRFQKNFHDVAKAPYLWNPSKKMYVGYEDKRSLQFKVDYAVSKNLGGIAMWSVDLDDDQMSLLDVVFKAPLCISNNSVNYKCSPIAEKRWWTWDEDNEKSGKCGKSAPLYKGYYPVCDPEDEGFSCCGSSGYCGSGPEFCDCPTCIDYGKHPEKIVEEPTKP